MGKQVAARPRTDFPSAVQQVLKVLSDGRSYTINRLAQEANLNFRTVKKVMDLIEQTQRSLQSKRIDVSATSDNHTIVQAREKSGLASLPEHIQNMVIKSIYPSITEEERVLVHLLKRGAVSKKTATWMAASEALNRLAEAEHVIKTGDRFYLTKDAQMIAKGALSLYPELQEL